MELVADSRLQTEWSKAAVHPLSLGMGNFTTIMQGCSEIHGMWLF